MPIDLPPLSLQDAERLYERPAEVASPSPTEAGGVNEFVAGQKNVALRAREQALADAGLSVGIKAGIVWQLRIIQRVVERHARDFDSYYDFGPLMIRDRVVPPVITEARDLYNQDGDFSLRLSGAYYKIESQAKFSSVVPSWRSYLTFPAGAVDRTALLTGIRPRDDAEQKLWKLAVDDGWKQGIEQANLMFKEGLDRLNRDLTGMLRFHTFVFEGKITLPVIASSSLPVSPSGSTLAVDETLFRITTLPEFNTKAGQWHASVVSTSAPPRDPPAPPPQK